MARNEVTVTVKDIPEVKALIAQLTERAEKAEADLAALHTLLTHPDFDKVRTNHHYRRSGVHGSCSCRGDYGPGTETPEQWIAHLLEAGRLEHGIGGVQQ